MLASLTLIEYYGYSCSKGRALWEAEIPWLVRLIGKTLRSHSPRLRYLHVKGAEVHTSLQKYCIEMNINNLSKKWFGQSQTSQTGSYAYVRSFRFLFLYSKSASCPQTYAVRLTCISRYNYACSKDMEILL